MRKRKLLSIVIRDKGNNLLSVKYNYHVPRNDVPELLIQSALTMLNFDRTEAKKIVNELCDRKADDDLEGQLQKIRPLEHELDEILKANGIEPEIISEEKLRDSISFPDDEE